MQKTENDNLPQKLEHEDFLIFDEADEKQIQEANESIRNALVYELKGKKELSYIGLKHLTLLMSRRGEGFQVLEDECNLNDGIWYAKMKVKNIKTQHETVGYAQQSASLNGSPDVFARTKAFSKAERNAWRKQIPELQIKTFIELLLKKNPDVKQDLKKADVTSSGWGESSNWCMCDFNAIKLNEAEKKCDNCGQPLTDNQIGAVKK